MCPITGRCSRSHILEQKTQVNINVVGSGFIPELDGVPIDLAVSTSPICAYHANAILWVVTYRHIPKEVAWKPRRKQRNTAARLQKPPT